MTKAEPYKAKENQTELMIFTGSFWKTKKFKKKTHKNRI